METILSGRNYLLKWGLEKQDCIASHNGDFERWPELFPDEPFWPHLPAKRVQAEKDVVALEKALKLYMPTIREQKQVDLADIGQHIFASKIKERFVEAENMRAAVSQTRDAMQKTDDLDIRDLIRLDRWDRSIIYARIIEGLRACYCKAERLEKIVAENESDFAEAAKRAEYARAHAGRIELCIIRTTPSPREATPAPRVDSDFNPADR